MAFHPLADIVTEKDGVPVPAEDILRQCWTFDMAASLAAEVADVEDVYAQWAYAAFADGDRLRGETA